MVKQKYLLMADGKSVHTLKWVKELIKYLDIYLVSFSSISEQIKEILPKGNYFELNLKINPAGGNQSILLSTVKIAKLIKKIEPDFVNAHYITSYGFVAALIKQFFKIKGRLILSAWGTDILVTPWKNFLYWHITRFSLNKADFITSDSYYMSDKIISISSDKKPFTFPFGLDALPNLSIDNKDQNLFYSNRAFSKNYNIDKVINFFSMIVASYPKAKLIIANDGLEKSKLINLVNVLSLQDSVEFVGFLTSEQQNEYYKKSQFYISIPESDSTSVSLLEAMAYGCIPILSNIPANREWVIQNLNGCYYDDIYTDLKNLLYNRKEIFDINRKIIKTNAIWSYSIGSFLKAII